MMRMATAAAILALSAGTVFITTGAASANPAVDEAMVQQITAAETDYEAEAFDQVVETLAPAVAPEALAALSPDMQYEALGLYARALYRLGAFDDAHEAFISLTLNPNATPADWALRMDTAERVGDAEDAELAHDRLDEDDSDTAVTTA